MALPTARSYAGADHIVEVRCRPCGHHGRLDLNAIAHSPLADRPLIHLKLRCKECGSTDVLSTVRYDDARYRDPPEK
jgi:hypothetical protein